MRSAHVGTGTELDAHAARPERDLRPLALDRGRARRLDRQPHDAAAPQVPVFGGQQAVVAIHGWHAGGGSSGSVSHGCVRVADDSLMRMVALKLPVGTPVHVT